MRRYHVPLWRLTGILSRKCDFQFEQSTLPYGLILAWDGTIPYHQIKRSVCSLAWLCNEAKRMILSPVLTFLLKTTQRQRHLVLWLWPSRVCRILSLARFVCCREGVRVGRGLQSFASRLRRSSRSLDVVRPASREVLMWVSLADSLSNEGEVFTDMWGPTSR